VIPEIDLLAGAFYGEGARETYAWMRAVAPAYFDEKNQLWALSTYDGVLAAERDATTFSNAGGSRPDTGPLPWMIDMDGRDHAKRRKLVSRGFTPGRVRASEAHVRALCDGLLDRALDARDCDLVRAIAAPLPMIVIGDMLGIPATDRDQLLRWSDAMLGSLTGAPGALEAAADAFGAYDGYARALLAARRQDPRDDLVSVLVHARVDGEHLADDEIVMEALLLLVGGDETTRHVISGGIEQLLAHPDALTMLRRRPEVSASAVEEMLRWVSPIKNMNRTTTRRVDLFGVSVPAGSKVLLLYESANFDGAQFADPDRFDVERSPNDHVAFGFGAHFCLGASLARLEVRSMLERMLARTSHIEALGPAVRSPIGTIESFPVRLAAR